MYSGFIRILNKYCPLLYFSFRIVVLNWDVSCSGTCNLCKTERFVRQSCLNLTFFMVNCAIIMPCSQFVATILFDTVTKNIAVDKWDMRSSIHGVEINSDRPEHHNNCMTVITELTYFNKWIVNLNFNKDLNKTVSFDM